MKVKVPKLIVARSPFLEPAGTVTVDVGLLGAGAPSTGVTVKLNVPSSGSASKSAKPLPSNASSLGRSTVPSPGLTSTSSIKLPKASSPFSISFWMPNTSGLFRLLKGFRPKAKRLL